MMTSEQKLKQMIDGELFVDTKGNTIDPSRVTMQADKATVVEQIDVECKDGVAHAKYFVDGKQITTPSNRESEYRYAEKDAHGNYKGCVVPQMCHWCKVKQGHNATALCEDCMGIRVERGLETKSSIPMTEFHLDPDAMKDELDKTKADVSKVMGTIDDEPSIMHISKKGDGWQIEEHEDDCPAYELPNGLKMGHKFCATVTRNGGSIKVGCNDLSCMPRLMSEAWEMMAPSPFFTEAPHEQPQPPNSK